MAGMSDAQPSDSVLSCPLQQHPYFAAALRVCGQAPTILPGQRQIIALRRQFWPGIFTTMLPRIQVDPQDLGDQLTSAGLHRSLLIISPDMPQPELANLGLLPLVAPATIAEIDLRPSMAIRRDRLHQKWRNRLCHAEAIKSLRITQRNMPLDATHWLFTADAKMRKQRKYRNWPTALTLAYARENHGQAKLFVASEGRNPIAAMLFLRHGTRATYHIGHTTARGRQVSAHTLLLWHVTNWLAAKGHQTLELGLIDTENAAGLARFKLGAGARPRTLGGTWGWWPPLGRFLRRLAALDRRLMRPPVLWTVRRPTVI